MFMALWRKIARSSFSLNRSEAARRPAALFGPLESQPARPSAANVELAPIVRPADRKARRSRPSFSAGWRRGSQSLLMVFSAAPRSAARATADRPPADAFRAAPPLEGGGQVDRWEAAVPFVARAPERPGVGEPASRPPGEPTGSRTAVRCAPRGTSSRRNRLW